MSEVKLRAWDRMNQIWYYSTDSDFTFSPLGNAVTHGSGRLLKLTDGNTSVCTGLSDTDGVEIYEGDILQGSFEYAGHLNRCKRHDTVRVVRWNENSASFDASPIYFNNPEHPYRVIGNIYENPELLEASSQDASARV